ncbi:hypothetical protein BMS3Bbin11_00607 [bacterium BMS3Bbin11]|nr:hypothetical protein BMS3Bbin11_00607 [bacterium BMS3Bbin11]
MGKRIRLMGQCIVTAHRKSEGFIFLDEIQKFPVVKLRQALVHNMGSPPRCCHQYIVRVKRQLLLPAEDRGHFNFVKNIFYTLIFLYHSRPVFTLRITTIHRDNTNPVAVLNQLAGKIKLGDITTEEAAKINFRNE